jgi:predicted CXXCH cytochrome family protein
MRQLVLGIITVSAAAVALLASDARQITFNREVLPILQKHCQSCHRPGQAAPMSLLSYQEARPWAKANPECGCVPQNASLVCRFPLRTFF